MRIIPEEDDFSRDFPAATDKTITNIFRVLRQIHSVLIFRRDRVQYIMASAVGLDIGWGSIKAVELTHDLKILKVCKVVIPRPIKGFEDKIYKEKIGWLFTTQKLSKDSVVTNLRGSYILARTYTPPTSDKDAFEHWFVENIEELIPGAPLSDVMYDHHFLVSGRVLIAFARLKAVEKRIEILESAQIMPVAIDASCLALFHAFESHRLVKDKRNFAIIDIGGQNTDLLLVKNGTPIISTEIACGGQDIPRRKGKAKIFAQLLAERLSKIFRFYKEKEDVQPECLMLTGDYVQVTGLKKYLSDNLDLKVITGNPFNKKTFQLPDNFNRRTSAQYAQAYGLALRGLQPENGINLMPPDVRDRYKARQFDKRSKALYTKNVIGTSIMLVILLIFLVFGLRRHNVIAGEIKDLKLQKENLAHVTTEENALLSKMHRLKQLGIDQYMWSRLIHNIGTAVPDAAYLNDISTEFRLVQTEGTAMKQRKLVIEGAARNHETVIRFVKNLEKFFEHIMVDKIIEESECEFKISLLL